jgi:hypothetical protein
MASPIVRFVDHFREGCVEIADSIADRGHATLIHIIDPAIEFFRPSSGGSGTQRIVFDRFPTHAALTPTDVYLARTNRRVILF